MFRITFFSLVFLPILLASGCTSLGRNPVPTEQLDEARVPGFSDIRTWIGRNDDSFGEDLLLSIKQESSSQTRAYSVNRDGSRSYNNLVLSGGADYGAFGAGFLKGWSETGKRPLFKTVTGVSTGALIAPFAFLGAKYDPLLEQNYTNTTPDKIFLPKLFSGVLFGESVADTTPLKETIRQSVNDDLVDEIAAAHRQGRRLYVGTTNLDAERFTVWNMGLIATSQQPGRYALFREILLASSALPAAFPPVHIGVQIGGKRYEEMHVDGGTMTQMFYVGSLLQLDELKKRLPRSQRNIRHSNLYIIRHGKTSPDPRPVKSNLVDIAGRSLALSIKASGFNDLYRIYALSQPLGIRFHYVAIPDDHRFESFDLFDQKEMLRLFEKGYELGRQSSPWKTSPPALKPLK